MGFPKQEALHVCASIKGGGAIYFINFWMEENGKNLCPSENGLRKMKRKSGQLSSTIHFTPADEWRRGGLLSGSVEVLVFGLWCLPWCWWSWLCYYVHQYMAVLYQRTGHLELFSKAEGLEGYWFDSQLWSKRNRVLSRKIFVGPLKKILLPQMLRVLLQGSLFTLIPLC